MFSQMRWWLVWLLFAIINYMDRAAVSVAAPLIARDLHLDPAELGIAFSIFFFAYAPFCFSRRYEELSRWTARWRILQILARQAGEEAWHPGEICRDARLIDAPIGSEAFAS